MHSKLSIATFGIGLLIFSVVLTLFPQSSQARLEGIPIATSYDSTTEYTNEGCSPHPSPSGSSDISGGDDIGGSPFGGIRGKVFFTTAENSQGIVDLYIDNYPAGSFHNPPLNFSLPINYEVPLPAGTYWVSAHYSNSYFQPPISEWSDWTQVQVADGQTTELNITTNPNNTVQPPYPGLLSLINKLKKLFSQLHFNRLSLVTEIAKAQQQAACPPEEVYRIQFMYDNQIIAAYIPTIIEYLKTQPPYNQLGNHVEYLSVQAPNHNCVKNTVDIANKGAIACDIAYLQRLVKSESPNKKTAHVGVMLPSNIDIPNGIAVWPTISAPGINVIPPIGFAHDTQRLLKLFRHELGHSIAFLGDEYDLRPAEAIGRQITVAELQKCQLLLRNKHDNVRTLFPDYQNSYDINNGEVIARVAYGLQIPWAKYIDQSITHVAGNIRKLGTVPIGNPAPNSAFDAGLFPIDRCPDGNSKTDSWLAYAKHDSSKTFMWHDFTGSVPELHADIIKKYMSLATNSPYFSSLISR